jgi:cell division septal protein FtsQ
MKKNKRRNPVLALLSQRWLLINAACLLALAGAAMAIESSLKNSDYFMVRSILVREKDDVANGESRFAYFKGMNIFRINLAQEAARIVSSYPSYRKIRLTRYLPDCILVDFLRRSPAAELRSDKSYYIDDNGYLFDQPGSAELPGIPVITGLERKIFSSGLGRKCTLREVVLSLQIINGIRQDRALSAYRIRTIDASAPDALAFVFAAPARPPAEPPVRQQAGQEGIEVRVGEDNIPAKLEILSTVLAQMKSRVENIKYIDLRFKEPVIKFKKMEKVGAG